MSPVYAAIDIGNTFQPASKFSTFGSLISVLLPNIYVFAGLVLFFLLIFGGIGLIMGSGGGDPRKAEQSKNAVTYALVGFLIIFVSYWIVQLIEAITGVKIFNSNL